MSIRESVRRGEPAIWLTGTGLGISLLMIAGMIGLILVNGLGFFWPRPLTRVTLADGSAALGEIVAREEIPMPAPAGEHRGERIQLKVGQPRSLQGADFRWIDEPTIQSRSRTARRDLRRAPRIRSASSARRSASSTARRPSPRAPTPCGARSSRSSTRHRTIASASRTSSATRSAPINAEMEAERLALRAAELRLGDGP